MSTIQSFSFPFEPSKSTAAGETAFVDEKLERKLYCEVVSALRGDQFDEAVLAVYSSRPERDLEVRETRRGRKYLFAE